MWIAWVHVLLLKGDSFFMIKEKANNSWCWKKVLKLIDKVRPMILSVVGNGEDIFQRHDYWHPTSLVSVWSQSSL